MAFWNRKEIQLLEQHQAELKDIRRQLAEVTSLIGQQGGQLSQVEERSQQLNEQSAKASRYQYKSTQEIVVRLDKLDQGVTAIGSRQEEFGNAIPDAQRLGALESNVNTVSLSLIQWIDDIDHLCRNLQEQDSSWARVLVQWESQLLESLARLEIEELDVINKPFDPRLAEAVESLSESEWRQRHPQAGELEAYQVVDTIRRGYVKSGTALLRKAKVITIRG